MTIKSTDKDGLNAAFAEKVAGWKRRPMGAIGTHRKPDAFYSERGWECNEINPTQFTTSADAVLPWLEKWKFNKASRWVSGKWLVSVSDDLNEHVHKHAGYADTFSLATVICLLRANGVTVED